MRYGRFNEAWNFSGEMMRLFCNNQPKGARESRDSEIGAVPPGLIRSDPYFKWTSTGLQLTLEDFQLLLAGACRTAFFLELLPSSSVVVVMGLINLFS